MEPTDVLAVGIVSRALINYLDTKKNELVSNSSTDTPTQESKSSYRYPQKYQP